MAKALVLVLMVAAALLTMATPAWAKTYSGTCGTCTWSIDEEGLLTIAPERGSSGTLKSSTVHETRPFPWNEHFDDIKRVKVAQGVKGCPSLAKMFYQHHYIADVDLSGLDLSATTDLSEMFDGCQSLQTVTWGSASTASVTNISSMFAYCNRIQVIDLSRLDLRAVKDMSHLAQGCESLTELRMPAAGTPAVTDASYLFAGCKSLTSANPSWLAQAHLTAATRMFDGCAALGSVELSSLHLGGVSDLSGLFNGCESLTGVNTEQLDVSGAEDLSSLFQGCSSLSSIDLSPLDTGKATSMSLMFSGCTSLSSLDPSQLDTGSLENASGLFSGCVALTSIDLSRLDLHEVRDLSNLFRDCAALTSYALPDTGTPHLTTTNGMFSGCKILPSVDVDALDFSGVTDAGSMFYDCEALTSIDLSRVELRGVQNASCLFSRCEALESISFPETGLTSLTSTSDMFSYCESLEQIDLSGFDTSNVTDMSSMFYGCSRLASLDVSGFDTHQVTNMRYMFAICPVYELAVSDFDTSKVTDMSGMFTGCYVQSLDLSRWQTSQVKTMEEMFQWCHNLTTLDISSFDTSGMGSDCMEDMFDGCTDLESFTIGERFYGPIPAATSTTGAWWSTSERLWFEPEAIEDDRRGIPDTYTKMGDGYVVGKTTSTDKHVYPDFAGLHDGVSNTLRTGIGYTWFSPISISTTSGYAALGALASEQSYPIPGLEVTRIGDEDYCDAMVPQGVCVTDDFVLVSAYCSWSEKDGMKHSLESNATVGGNPQLAAEIASHHCHESVSTHDSVIYVLDRTDGRYLKTLVLEGFGGLSGTGNHVGGITFDGGSVWVAMSMYKPLGKVQECRIPLSAIEEAVDTEGRSDSVVLATDQFDMVPCSSASAVERASVNTWYDGLLWVGEFKRSDDKANCRLVGFEPVGDKLVARRTIYIPKSANGITFAEHGGQTYLIMNRSTGRKHDSSLLVWPIDPSQATQTVQAKDARVINVPPMMEELCVDGDDIYSVYEGGALVYAGIDGWKNRCNTTIDEICVGSLSGLLDGDWTWRKGSGRSYLTSLLVECPVDVTGYDSDGCVVCQIKDGVVDEETLAYGVKAYEAGDAKYVIYPSDQEYRFEIVATDAGSMSVTVCEYGEDEECPAETNVEYEDLALRTGQTYEVAVASSVDVGGADPRTTITTDGQQCEPSHVGEDRYDPWYTEVRTSIDQGSGWVTESYVIKFGDVGIVEAVPDEGQQFLGWYESGELVSKDATYAFVAKWGPELHARFGQLEEPQPEPEPEPEPIDISGATASVAGEQTYTGEALEPAVSVELEGKVLQRDVDYTVSYANNVEVGTATVTIAGIGDYTGSLTASFKIVAPSDPGPGDDPGEDPGEDPGDDPGDKVATVAVYRLYNKKTSEHLWTTSANEYKQLPIITKGDWRQEDVAWMAPDGVGTPVYRLYNKKMGDHYYSMDENEVRVLTTKHGWTVDNGGAPAFWSAAKGDAGAIPLYCVYNSRLKKGQHHFTRSVAERDFLTTKAGWRYEKEAFYGYPPA